MLELLKVIFLGIVEGITEWLPISSTGHMLLVDQFLQLKADDQFKDMFFVVIQLGAILAVIVIYWKKLWPFARVSTLDAAYHESEIPADRSRKIWRPENVVRYRNLACNKKILQLWLKVIVATIPAAVFGLLLDDWADAHLHTPLVIAIALIVYGILFILIENQNQARGRKPRLRKISHIQYPDALKIGLFQVLAIIPGTSRSGSTILGGLLSGYSRSLATEFSFFMSIPVMFGWSLVKLVKFGLHYSAFEFLELILGMAVAFFVSVFVIRKLMNYIRKHNFKVFGYYRIGVGILVLILLLCGVFH